MQSMRNAIKGKNYGKVQFSVKFGFSAVLVFLLPWMND